jgi:hypothetical protein
MPVVLLNSRIVATLDRKRLGEDTFKTKLNSIRGVFDKQTRRKPLVFAAESKLGTRVEAVEATNNKSREPQKEVALDRLEKED